MVRQAEFVVGIAVALIVGGRFAAKGPEAELAVEAYIERGDNSPTTVLDASRRGRRSALTHDDAGLNDTLGGVGHSRTR